MKKLVLILAAMLMATPALALIDNSGHDIPSSIGGGAGATDEICVFCHTPHGANTAFSGGPLWNRSTPGGGLTGVYTSATLNATIDTDYTKIDAAACISCHDGTLSLNALQNPPNTGFLGANYASNLTTINSNAVLGLNMSNDHPVNFDYNAVMQGGTGSVDAEIEPYANLAAVIQNGFKKVGATNIMQCSTCHDVHNTVGNDLILIDNHGSNLCRECHIK